MRNLFWDYGYRRWSVILWPCGRSGSRDEDQRSSSSIVYKAVSVVKSVKIGVINSPIQNRSKENTKEHSDFRIHPSYYTYYERGAMAMSASKC